MNLQVLIDKGNEMIEKLLQDGDISTAEKIDTVVAGCVLLNADNVLPKEVFLLTENI